MSRTLPIGEEKSKHFGARVEVKALNDAGGEPGQFEALAAVFGNVDLDGERMVKGAFSRTLQERGYPAVVWSHDRYVPPIGVVSEASETDEGLLIKGRLFVADGEDHAIARQVYAAMKSAGGDGRPALRDFSFGYRVRKATERYEDPDTLPPELQWTGGYLLDIEDVDLWEIGPTLVGANPSAGLLGMKSLARDLVDAVRGKSDGDPPSPAPDPSQDIPDGGHDPADTPVIDDRKHAARLAELLVTTPATPTSSEDA